MPVLAAFADFANPARQRSHRRPRVGLILALAGLLALDASAQTAADRERQQMMQLQQQLQKLRQENAQLKDSATQDVAKARADTERARRDASAQVQARGSASQREISRLGDELATARQALATRETEAEKLRADLAQRDTALQAAGQQMTLLRSKAEGEQGVLGTRLKLNNQRADQCEARHAQAMAVAQEVIDRHETQQLRACEPFTGIWRVGQEQRIQALRDRLFEARLDVAPADTAPAEASSRAKADAAPAARPTPN